MDQGTLVASDIEIGALVIDALSRIGIPVTLCDWNYVPELEEWQLVIATPWYDSKGPRQTYGRVVDALDKAGVHGRVPISRVFLKSPNDPLVKVLQEEASHRSQGFIHLVHRSGPDHRNQYSVIFAPISRRGGAVPVRHFSRREELQQFLIDQLHLRSSSVEEALMELAQRGSSSIYPVQLTARELKKSGLA